MFSSDNRAVFICLEGMFQLWRPYVDDDDEDRLITLYISKLPDFYTNTFSLSHDNTMVAIHEKYEDKGKLFSIDMDHRCLALKLDFPKSTGLFFTSDGKYIVSNTQEGPKFWSIAKNELRDSTMLVMGTDLTVINSSPNNRQIIVLEAGNFYITSYFVK